MDAAPDEAPLVGAGVALCARLDFHRHGGDSLRGRYHLLRLHALSAGELGLRRPAEPRDLLTLGGFPEPYFGGDETQARRSRELLMVRPPELVGSPLSVNALREDLQVPRLR